MVQNVSTTFLFRQFGFDMDELVCRSPLLCCPPGFVNQGRFSHTVPPPAANYRTDTSLPLAVVCRANDLFDWLLFCKPTHAGRIRSKVKVFALSPRTFFGVWQYP